MLSTMKPKKVAEQKVRDESVYIERTEIEHLLASPDQTIGSKEKAPRTEWILNDAEDSIVRTEIQIPFALERIYFEIIHNASDCIRKSRREGLKGLGSIKISMDKHTITVSNRGLGIPIAQKKLRDKVRDDGTVKQGKTMWIPELIFGRARNSDNYRNDDEADFDEVAGKNGIGAKATNAFSKRFKIVIIDPIRKKRYEQIWIDNMSKALPPTIADTKEKEVYIEVSYDADLARFGYEEYDEEAFRLFHRHAIDLSANAKIPVDFNDKRYELDIEGLAGFYFPSLIETAVGGMYSDDKSYYNRIEWMMFDTTSDPDLDAAAVSFVNSVYTRDGGSHVEAAYRTLKPLIDNLNQTSGVRLTMKEIKDNVSIIVIARVSKPDFGSQSKHALHSKFNYKFSLPLSEFKIVQTKWTLIETLEAIKERKRNTKAKKGVSRNKRPAKITDANLVTNSRKSEDTILALGEGDSVTTYMQIIRDLEGADYFGYMPVRGKVLNTRKASEKVTDKDKVLSDIRAAIGLENDLDYEVKANFDKLYYKQLWLMMDADDDGNHIAGLILNWFDLYFPSLLKIGFVKRYRTRLVACHSKRSRKSPVLKFYFLKDFQKWQEGRNDLDAWDIKYYKGLASSDRQDTIDDYKTIQLFTYGYTSKLDEEALDLAFSEGSEDGRKEWIAKWMARTGDEDEVENIELDPVANTQPIHNFINEDMIQYSVASNKRAIPRLLDGLKEVHRKVLHTVFKVWNIHGQTPYKLWKMIPFAGSVFTLAAYHHGDAALYDTIKKMAQSYVGHNNLPYFVTDTRYGSRLDGGKKGKGKDDAGGGGGNPRYLDLIPSPLLRYILRKEDMDLITYRTVDGELAEPKFFPFIIPMVLINGESGIGTGWSTDIPQHNPLDCIDWLIAKIDRKALPPVEPWYLGFTGEIELRKVNGGYKMITRGEYKQTDEGVTITELPIGVWTKKYKAILEKMKETKKITNWRDNGTINKPNFTIIGPNFEVNDKTLQLEKSKSMMNMILLREDMVPTRYTDATEILENFYSARFDLYVERHQKTIEGLKKRLHFLINKNNFVIAIINEEINVVNISKATVIAQMIELEIEETEEVYQKTDIPRLSTENIRKANEKIAIIRRQIADLEKITPGQLWKHELLELRDKYYQFAIETERIWSAETAPKRSAARRGGRKRAS